MRWYRRLFVGETAKKDKYKIIGKLRLRRPQIDAYIITLASNSANLLDIYPANQLLFPYFRKQDYFIVGIARGYEEAAELAFRIIVSVYKATGSFAVKEYFEKQNHKGARQ